MEENLGQRNVGRKNVIAELAGPFATAGEGIEIIEQHPVLPLAPAFQHFVISQAVKATIERDMASTRMTPGQFELTERADQIQLSLDGIGAIQALRPHFLMRR